MKRRVTGILLALAPIAAIASASDFPRTPLNRCAPDAVAAGTACIDRYEETVWRVADATTTNASLVGKIQHGRATRADLIAGGATQLGTAVDDYAPCRDDGQNCANDIYAVSLPGEIPAQFITWFQAQEACANSGKRLPTSAEWQVGANGTPDPGTDNGTTDCNIGVTSDVVDTGARTACVSARGVRDAGGNVDEWVAEWVPRSTNCPSWGGFSRDLMCLSGASIVDTGPGAVARGSSLGGGTQHGGPLAVVGSAQPNFADPFGGFRCAR